MKLNYWRKHPGLVKALLICLLLLVIVVVFIRNTINPIFFSLAKAEAVRIANRAINEAVDSEVESINYDDLITYKVNKDGNIVLMQPNIREINRFSSKMSLKIQNKLEQIKNKEISIPLLKLLGIELIAGFGPYINAKIIPIGFLHPPEVRDSIETAGINQTRHKIYLRVDVKLKLIVPFSHRTTVVSADVPVIEVTILGEVPDVYVGLDNKGGSGIINNQNNKN